MIKLIKAHWECWSKCNLHCGFCYRMKEDPLNTHDAKNMLSEIKKYGFRDFVFAGGDPSLRKDIGILVKYASKIGLNVEVQTNAHIFERTFSGVFEDISLFGFSLDADIASVHDNFRKTKGNFERVVNAINICENLKIPYIVRSVVTSENKDSIIGISETLCDKNYLKKWSILQFSPVGDGYTNQDHYLIDDDLFLNIASRIKKIFPKRVDIFPNSKKGGVYFLIKPNGDVYTTQSDFSEVNYPIVGNIMKHGVPYCSDKLGVFIERHNQRYKDLMR